MRRTLPSHLTTSPYSTSRPRAGITGPQTHTAGGSSARLRGSTGSMVTARDQGSTITAHAPSTRANAGATAPQASVAADPPDRVVRTRGPRIPGTPLRGSGRPRAAAPSRIRCGDCAGHGLLQEDGELEDVNGSRYWYSSVTEACRECRGTGYVFCDHCREDHAQERAPVRIHEFWCTACAESVRAVMMASEDTELQAAGLPPTVLAPLAQELTRVFRDCLADEVPHGSFFRDDWLHTRTTRLPRGASPFEALARGQFRAVGRLLVEQTGDLGPLAMALALGDNRPRRSALARAGVVLARFGREGHIAAAR